MKNSTMTLSKTTNHNPQITVVIPAWNLDDVLKKAVESIRKDNETARILIVDNASDSPLPKISGTSELKLAKRVTVGEARDAALPHITTPYTLFMDADDLLLSGTLAFLRRQLESNPKAIFATCSMIDWNPITNAKHAAPYPPKYSYVLQGLRRTFALLNAMRYRTLVVGATLHRTDVIKATPGFGSSNYGEDWAFSAVLCFLGPIRMTKRPGKLYRIDPNQSSLRVAPKSDSLVKRYRALAPQYRTAMKEVRARIRKEKSVPLWAKMLIPVIFMGQYVMFIAKLLSRPRTV